jgi:hypothetical protein
VTNRIRKQQINSELRKSTVSTKPVPYKKGGGAERGGEGGAGGGRMLIFIHSCLHKKPLNIYPVTTGRPINFVLYYIIQNCHCLKKKHGGGGLLYSPLYQMQLLFF